MTNSKIIASALAAASILAGAAPASAAPASTSATWEYGCTIAVAKADKDISNIVFRVDGVDTKIEFRNGTHMYLLPAAATDIWVKSGNNASGDGPGYGQHFQRPENCGSDSSTVTLTDPMYGSTISRMF